MTLLERAPYLNELRKAARQAAAGQGCLYFLGGEAGVGKSALISSFCQGVRSDLHARVVVGACDPFSTPRPLGPVLDVAAQVGGTLQRLTREGTPRHRLFSAFLAELDHDPPPTVAVFEDVHWADEASLDLLRFLGRRIAHAHGLVITTYRDDELGPTHPLRVVIGDLAPLSSVRRLALPPLSLAGVQTLAAGSDQDPIALHRHTGGNPFL